jgi:DNA-binding GntR family transcriptional regulator
LLVDTLQPVPATSLRDSVLPALRRAILDGRLPAGTRLSEIEISRTMHVSRSPVREAIAQLEKEGLAERIPNRGAFVADVYSGRAISELASVRNVLECFAISQVAPRVNKDMLAPLLASIADMQDAVNRRQHDEIGEADFRFHESIVRMAGNRTLLQTWRGIASHYWEIYLPRIQAMERDIEHWGRNHQLIVDAIAEGRFDLATMYLQFNILNPAEQLRALLPDAADPARNAQDPTIDASYLHVPTGPGGE